MIKYKFTFDQQTEIITASDIVKAIKKFKKLFPEVRSYTVTK